MEKTIKISGKDRAELFYYFVDNAPQFFYTLIFKDNGEILLKYWDTPTQRQVFEALKNIFICVNLWNDRRDTIEDKNGAPLLRWKRAKAAAVTA